MTTFKTANTSVSEYFTVIEEGKMNTKIALFDCSGFIGNKIVPNASFEKMVRMSKTVK